MNFWPLANAKCADLGGDGLVKNQGPGGGGG